MNEVREATQYMNILRGFFAVNTYSSVAAQGIYIHSNTLIATASNENKKLF